MASMIILCAVLISISAYLALTNQQIARINQQLDISASIQKDADDLNSISSQYFLYQQDYQLALWQSNFTSISEGLSHLNSSSPEQLSNINKFNANLIQLNITFSNLVQFLQSAPRNVSVRVLPEFQNDWNSLVSQHQALGDDSASLSTALRNQDRQLDVYSLALILSLIAAFGAFILINYVVFYRRTLKSISNLQKGTNTVALGNLDYLIPADNKDEIGELAQSFNRMTTSLRNVTASKADLEKEVIERKKAEAEAIDRAEKLQQVQLQLEEKAAEVGEYASRMEELAEERAKQLEDSERMAAIGQTAGMVGHDIRNPLQSILSAAYLAKRELEALPDSESKQSISESLIEIESSIEYVNKIVVDLQDYARPLKPSLRQVDLEEVFDELLLKAKIPENIKASCEVSTKKIVADPDLLKRVLTNLVGNAVQAMPKGGALEIRSRSRGRSVVISVQDTGHGIPDDAKPKLFTPLFTTKSKGQGFGLAVVKRLTDAMGGEVSFHSEIGKGSTFEICLPNQPA